MKKLRDAGRASFLFVETQESDKKRENLRFGYGIQGKIEEKGQ
ncbi:MAG: hypothetical protein JWL77_3923 [Chthonomonadaceae bacterium]|nr:hypothetical protein [Chthonomonadaceae bacterium]